MHEILANTGSVLIGYALGCLTTGYYLVRQQRGDDVRDLGSRSSGATNVGRLLGPRGFVITFTGDLSKGVVALLLAEWCGVHDPWLALVLLAVVAGHIWPIQLRFNGGKGVATTLGGLIVYEPILLLASAVIFFVSYLVSRDRHTSGIISFPCLPVIAVVMCKPFSVLTASLALALLLLWTHRHGFETFFSKALIRKN